MIPDRSLDRAARGVVAAAAAYAAITLVRYYIAPRTPRFPVESAFFIFVGVGVLAVLARRAVPDGPGRHDIGQHRAEPGTPGASLAVLAAAFILSGFVLYAPALGIGLLSDDFVIAGWAERLQLVHFEATGFVRPGVPVFWWLLQKLPGDFAAAAHAANLVLHGVNAALVSLIALQIGLRRAEAVAAGALFALFPGLSEAIVWLSGVQDVLMAALTLTAVALAAAVRPHVMAAVAASAAALLVKETAIVIPVLAGLVIVGRAGLRPGRPQRAVLVALAAVSALYVLARLAAGVPSSLLDIGDWRYFVKQWVANSFAALGAPWTDEWGRTHAGLALMRSVSILVLAAAAFFHWRRGDATARAAAACAGWVLAATLPALSLFYVGPLLEGSRYVYLPAAGFAILLALLTGRAANRAAQSARPAAIGVMTGVLALPFLPAIKSDLARWQAAAGRRDDVLVGVRDQASRLGCTTFVSEGEVDSVSGAYVFRHGLEEALARPDGGGVVPCRVSMTGGNLRIGPAR